MRHPLKTAALLFMLAALALQSGCGGKSGNSAPVSGFTITVTPPTASVVVGSIRQFSAQARDANGLVIAGVTFAWASSDSRIALSLGNGAFRGVALGGVSVTATATLGGGVTHTTPQIITSNVATLSVVTAVEGTAAEGAPITGASVSLRDADGQYAAGGTDAAGHFHIPTDGMTAPFLLKVTAADGHVLYGMAVAPGTANLDPYSDLLVRDVFALRGADADQAFAGRGGLPAAADLDVMDRALTGILRSELTDVGLDAGRFSVLGTPFAADHTGFDKVLDESEVDTAAGRIRAGGETTLIGLDRAGASLSWETFGGPQGSLRLP